MKTKFLIRKTSKSSSKAYCAIGKNPNTGKRMRISGGVKGVIPGPKAQGIKKARNFQKRHGEPKTPKQYINKIRWKKGNLFGKNVYIPNKLF